MAQIPGFIPGNSQTYDMTSFVTNSVDQLVNAYSGVLLGVVSHWVLPGLFMVLIMAGLAWLFDAPAIGLKVLFTGVLTYAVAHFLLTYWAVPLPVIGVPFSQIFRFEGRYLAAIIDISSLNVFLKNVSNMFTHSDKPNPWNLFETLAYYIVLMSLALPEIALFVETSFAIIALGIGAVLGPIFVALLVWPFSWCRQLFWAFIHYMIKYMLYRVVAAALVFIWVGAETLFINYVFAGKYTLAAFAGTLLGLVVFNVSAAITCFRVGRIVNDMTTGGAHSGGGIIGSVVGAASFLRFV